MSFKNMMLVSRSAEEGYRGPLPEETARTSILIAMVTLSIYMAALVDLKTLVTFKRRNTLYFWSLLITSWGIIFHSLGVILRWFVGSCPWAVYTAFSSFGWWGMITGQSLVLYSRLHLVVRNERVLRAVLIMIVIDFWLFQVPTTVQKFLCDRTNAGLWLTVYHIYERIQLIVFTIQELIISGIYIRAAVVWLSPSDPEGIRSTKFFLIYLNILCIALDVVIICEVSTGQWLYEEASQSLVYAVKLTLEFAVLNKVMEVYRAGPGGCICNRRFASRSVPSAHAGGSSSHASRNLRPNPKTSRISAAWRFLIAPSWPKRNPPSSERLEPYDEERMTSSGPLAIDVVTEIQAVSTPAMVRLEERRGGRKEASPSDDVITYVEERRDSRC